MALQTIVQTVARTLAEEMARDDAVVLLGEDVGKRGGVFLATEGLFDRFGPDRVIDTPLSEAAIIGAAIGMAVHGLRPVAEIQFADYVFPGFDQLVSQAAKLRYRSGGGFSAPMVVRMPAGGGVAGGHHHSQNPESHFVHTPGLQVVYPSTPSDTRGLLRSAVRGDDPVVFMEPKRLYRAVKEDLPDDDGRYRPADEVAAWRRRDPIARYRRYLEARGLWDDAAEDALTAEVKAEIDDAVRANEAAGRAPLGWMFGDVFAALPPHLRRQRDELALTHDLERDGH
jgi:2-oxoisovalerate dehydrogenase E1 component beta subunit